jgi:TPR repeat protein
LSLGEYYETGEIVTQDYTKAFEYYNQDVSHNIVEALNHLAICYQNGFGVDQSYTAAIPLFLEAISKGNVEAMIIYLSLSN